MDGRAALARLAAGGKRRVAAPKAPKVASVGPAGVTLRWSAPKGEKPAVYQVLRNGRVIARTTHHAYTDHTVKAGTTYKYAVRGVDKHGRRGYISNAIHVKVPKAKAQPIATPPNTPPASAGPTPSIAPIQQGSPPPAPDLGATLSTAMVDRLFWRAGFGPSDADRQTWTGRAHYELVDWLLDTPPARDTTIPPPLTAPAAPAQPGPIDPLNSDDECVMEWLDQMQRVDNPLVERLTFFWHRHWAVSRDDGIPNVWLIGYRDRLRSFANLPLNPDANFRDLARAMSKQDAAMSMYLNGSSNVKGAPNENYAREFMELFCLGPTGPDGTPNYAQADVQGLAKAFTGWRLDSNPLSPTYGTVTWQSKYFEPSDKTFLGQTIPASVTDGDACVNTAIDVVLSQANHPQFLIRKLWAEFIASPIPADTLADLTAAYRADNTLALRPVIRGILTHPLIFESIGEPNLVKPPVVYAVGLLRTLRAPMKGTFLRTALDNMQQRPYRPPNVAGWEGGLSWLNSNTVQARFDAVVRLQYLAYSTYYGASQKLPDAPAESPQAAFDRAYLAAGSPWLSDGTRATLMDYATTAPVTSAALLRQRFYTLQALMLGGPDGQVS